MMSPYRSMGFSSVTQSCPTLCDPMNHTTQASQSITNSRSPPKLMSIELVMPSNHLVLCRPLLLPPSIFPSIRVFSNESALHIRWPKDWSFSFSISPSSEQSYRSVWFNCLHVGFLSPAARPFKQPNPEDSTPEAPLIIDSDDWKAFQRYFEVDNLWHSYKLRP